jgi:Fe-S-cluster containining protein
MAQSPQNQSPEPLQQSLQEKLDEIHRLVDTETTCCRQCGCCRVACPQMHYAEAVQILDKVWNEWSAQDKKQLLVTSIRYFFSRSLVKPCPLLRGNECRVYENRPQNCRLFGLWPEAAWERRVQAMAAKLDLPKEKIPLNTQCPLVKRKSGKPRPAEEEIEVAYAALERLDLQILTGGTKGKQQEWETKIAQGWNYRAIHDWVLLKFWGEDRLAQMSQVAMAASEEQLQDLVRQFERMAGQLDLNRPLPSH